MNKASRLEVATTNSGETIFSKSWEDEDKLHHEVKVEEVEGGYIIKKSKWGEKKNKSGEYEYIDEHKKEVTKDNPIEKLTGGLSKKHEDILSALNNLGEGNGLIKGV